LDICSPCNSFARCEKETSAIYLTPATPFLAPRFSKPFAQGVQDILGGQASVEIAKRSELHTFKVMPQRWVVERSFAWLEKNRRLWKNCERWLNTSLQFLHLAFLALLLRRS